MSEASDEELIRLAGRGDEPACFALYERYKGAVYRFSLRMLRDEGLAGDVVQEVFEYFFRKVPEYRFEAKVTTLLLKAARNRCLNVLEKRRRRGGVSLEETGDVVDGAGRNPADHAECVDLADRAGAVLETLPPEFREVIVLKVIKGLTYDDIAAILDCPAGTVKSRLHNALQMMRKKMKFA
jgi:RNA polymerase sigma-70 factor (ECF subfamily)